MQECQLAVIFWHLRYLLELSLNVVQAFKYSGRGLMRHLTESLGDLARFNFNTIKTRFAVWTGRSEDPFLIYNELISRLEFSNIKLRFFFESLN